MKHLALMVGLCLLFLAPLSAQSNDSPFELGEVTPREVSPGVIEVELTATLRRSLPFAPTVPVPTAPLRLDGVLQIDALLENSILNSFLHEDMDGDGRLNQVLVQEWEKGVRIGGVKVETMGQGESRQEPYRSNGKMKRYMLDPEGPEFSVLYYRKPFMGLLMGHRTQRPEVLELPNPNLQVVVFEHSEPVKGPVFLPDPPVFKMTIDGQEPANKQLLFAWEPGLFEKMKLTPRWLRAWSVEIPLDPNPGTSRHVLRVEKGLASPNLGLYTQINYSTEPGVQLRTDRSVGPLWTRPQP